MAWQILENNFRGRTKIRLLSNKSYRGIDLFKNALSHIDEFHIKDWTFGLYQMLWFEDFFQKRHIHVIVPTQAWKHSPQ